MKRTRCPVVLATIAISFAGYGCDVGSPQDQGLSLRWSVEDNHLEYRYRSRLTLVNDGREVLESSGWTVYFNFLSTVDPETVTAPVNILHINGDLYSMVPAAGFQPLAGGESLEIVFEALGSAVGETDGPAGAYLVHDDGAQEGAILNVPIAIEPFITERQTDRGAMDNKSVMTPELEYARNLSVSLLPLQDVTPITPTPARLERLQGSVTLRPGTRILFDVGLEKEASLLAGYLDHFFGVTSVVADGAGGGADVVQLKLGDASLNGDEAYVLTVDTESGVSITGATAAGVFYGIQSLITLVPPDAIGSGTATVPATIVEDAPRFAYRGMHLDVSRNFQSKESVLKLLELMSFYKLNRFHFHLTDDEGWRLAIDGLPELTEIGGRRGHTTDERDFLVPSFGSGPDPDPAVSNGSGFYTRTDFVEILRFARDRHIEVIPEMDVPGHARAAIVAMKARFNRFSASGDSIEARRYLLTHPEDRSEYMSVQHWTDNVVDVCLPSTYDFIEYVFDDVIEMYREADATLTAIHTGGDEVPAGVWRLSPACAELRASIEGVHLPSYFLGRMNEMLSGRNLITAGWEEVALHIDETDHSKKEPDPSLVGKRVRPYVWNSIWGAGSEDLAYRLANAGFELVLSSASNFYFDLAYDKHPEEPGYAWAGYVNTRKPFELEPYDLYKSGMEDLAGNPIPPGYYSGREKLSETGAANILGVQGQLWGENAKGPQLMEYFAFPKLLGLAERAWAPRPEWSRIDDRDDRSKRLDEAWSEFANRLGQRELPRLDRILGGVNYRIPPPGATVADGTLKANVAFPSLEVRYTIDGSIPSRTSTLYAEPVAVDGTVTLRTFASTGRGSRSVRVNSGQ